MLLYSFQSCNFLRNFPMFVTLRFFSLRIVFLWVGRQFQDCRMGLRIHFVVDPHGWCCMGLIVFVWLYNIVLIPKIVLFPHYEEGHIPGILIISKFLSLIILYKDFSYCERSEVQCLHNFECVISVVLLTFSFQLYRQQLFWTRRAEILPPYPCHSEKSVKIILFRRKV